MIPALESPPRSTRLRAFSAAFVGAMMSIAPTACTDAAGPSAIVAGESLLFVSARAGYVLDSLTPLFDIYRMDTEGGDARRLTSESAAYKFLRLSPDATRVAFYADLGACYDIWTMDVDGGDLRQLTGVDAYERCNETPHWSPDGSRIAFVSTRDPQLGWDVYVMTADGAAVSNLSAALGFSEAYASEVVEGWSPDGRVVLRSDAAAGSRTWLVEADGSEAELLFGTGEYLHPYWSPDGTRVLVGTVRDGDRDLHVVHADGSGFVDIGSAQAFDGVQASTVDPWAPDGSRIAFYSRRTGDSEIFVVSADGTGLVNVSAHPGEDVLVGWSPDGSALLFASDREGNMDLFRVAPDGSGLVRLTDAPEPDGPWAVWTKGR